MKSVEQYRRWLQAKLDWLEEFPSHNMSPMDWVEAREIVDEAKEFAYQLRLEFPFNATAPPRRQLLELLNFIDEPSEDALIDLATAAELLGYKPAGLRKVVKSGQIRHVQNGNGPIKFRRQWVDEYIKANNPKGVERSPSQRRTPLPESTIPGFDPSRFKR